MLALVIVILLLAGTSAMAAYLTDIPYTITQPDGTVIECFASGDEYFNWLHDENGYVIIQNHDNGYYYYAERIEDDLVPSEYLVGKVFPGDIGLVPNAKPSAERLQEYFKTAFAIPPSELTTAAPKTGDINNIVIFIRFSDQAEFADSVLLYENQFNANTSGVSSMYNYFLEASYSKLSITSTLYPTATGSTVLSYQDSNPRAYYMPYNATTNPTGYSNESQRTSREHTLLVNAVNAVASQVPTSLNIDGDNDDRVDNVCFIIRGSTTAWSTLLWPHRWSLYSATVRINGKRVYDYNLQLQSYMNSSATAGVSVLCHEMFHSLGSPDLYHYTSNGISPCHTWDLMCSNTSPPQHMGAYMKWKYGKWIASIPTITEPGVYTLDTLRSSENNCYKIPSPNSTSEYFVVEYRKREGVFENSLPGSGLLVYRINPSYSGNSGGPPDEVYIYRPNGTTTSNGDTNKAAFSSNAGRTAINDSTNPSSFLTNGSPGGLDILHIGSYGGSTISFRVTFKLAVPVISKTPGTYTGPQLITITHPKPNAIIRYTTNGTDPTETNGFTYTGPFFINNDVTLKATAIMANWRPSEVVSASYTILPASTNVAAVKALPDYTNINFESILVTAVFSGYIYVEADDRSSGIRVNKTNLTVSVGDRVKVEGVIRTNYDFERYIAASLVTYAGDGIPRPLGMNNKAVGGADWKWEPAGSAGQRGVDKGYGLNNIGLLVRTTGKYIPQNIVSFYIDDGSGEPVGCILPSGVTVNPDWEYLAVTGISCCYRSGDVVKKMIRIRSSADIIAL